MYHQFFFRTDIRTRLHKDEQSVANTKRQTTRKEPASETKSTAVLPCNKRVSEALRRCL